MRGRAACRQGDAGDPRGVQARHFRGQDIVRQQDRAGRQLSRRRRAPTQCGQNLALQIGKICDAFAQARILQILQNGNLGIDGIAPSGGGTLAFGYAVFRVTHQFGIVQKGQMRAQYGRLRPALAHGDIQSGLHVSQGVA